MVTPSATTLTSPVPSGSLTPEQREKDCKNPATLLPLLPKIMANKGWREGARLMERWFSLPASSNPEHQQPSMISLKWALNFPRALRVYNHLIANRLWMNEAAKAEIFEGEIKEKGKLPTIKGVPVSFGDSGDGRAFTPEKMKLFHTDHNIQKVLAGDGIAAPLDDLLAALGDFHFHCAVEGKVTRLTDSPPHRYQVKIEKVGIYIRDSYDFNDRGIMGQPLGFWDCFTDDVKKFCAYLIFFNQQFHFS